MRNKLRLIIVSALSITVISVVAFAYNFNSNQHLIQETNLVNETKLTKETESKKVTKTTKIVTEDKAYSENVFKEKPELEEEYSYNYKGSKPDFSLYSDYGDFSYDKDNNVYTFDDMPIRFFYDENNIFIYNNSNAPDGVMIRVVRNSSGDIENLIKMTEEETEDFIANTKSLGGITLNSKTKQNSNSGATGKEFGAEFAKYEPYGFAYQQDEKKYLYNGKSVRCFIDIIDASNGSANIISGKTGDIDVFGVRDDKNNLTGLRVATKEEYDDLTKELENNGGSLWGYVRKISSKDKTNLPKENKTTKQDKDYGTLAKENKTIKQENNRYEHYKDYGTFEYNEDDEVWYFNDEPIRLFLDMDIRGKEEGTTSVSMYPNTNGILVQVNRDSLGEIKDITTISKEEAYKFLNSDKSKYGGLEWLFEKD